MGREEYQKDGNFTDLQIKELLLKGYTLQRFKKVMETWDFTKTNAYLLISDYSDPESIFPNYSREKIIYLARTHSLPPSIVEHILLRTSFWKAYSGLLSSLPKVAFEEFSQKTRDYIAANRDKMGRNGFILALVQKTCYLLMSWFEKCEQAKRRNGTRKNNGVILGYSKYNPELPKSQDEFNSYQHRSNPTPRSSLPMEAKGLSPTVGLGDTIPISSEGVPALAERVSLTKDNYARA